MCGIAGVVFAEGDSELDGVGARMIALLRHRGPDRQRYEILPRRAGVFAHTRLRVIDLSERASQPFASPDGRVFLVFNGEIYNFRALRQALEKKGTTFRSDSDTEVILAQYLQYGEAGLKALDGMFAIAIWDADKERLVLMRDRFGKKPLYYARTSGGALVFGSEVKALGAHDKFSLAPEPKSIPAYLAFGYVPTPNTAFRSVRRLPPASLLSVGRQEAPTIKPYWSLEDLDPTPHKFSLEEAKERVRHHIGKAVERRLEADVPLGAFLSGGIDSSVVVKEMAERTQKKVKTFSVGFEDDRTYDERKYARQVANMFGTDHTELVVSASPSDLLERLLYHHDEPYADSSALAVFAISQATKPFVTVVLCGDGGDELFAGYTRFRGGLCAGWVPPSLLGVVRKGLGFLPEPRGYKHPIALLKRFVEHADRSVDEQMLAWNSFFSGPVLGSILRKDLVGDHFDSWTVFEEQAALLARLRSRGYDRLGQILHHNAVTYLPGDLLVKTDRMTMAVGLEARSPFLDKELAEFAFRLPSSLQLRYGQLKWLLREAYRDTLPTTVLDRKKHGFGVPVSSWWSSSLRVFVEDLLLSSSARVNEYLDASVVRSLVAEHQSKQRDHGHRIFTLVQLELWLRSFGVQRARPKKPAFESVQPRA